MNLFNPRGQKQLQVTAPVPDQSYLHEEGTTGNGKSTMDNIQEIFRDEGGKGRMRNSDIQKKTE